jgi:hypothetical protein
MSASGLKHAVLITVKGLNGRFRNLQHLHELDPSFADGFGVIFNNEVPILFAAGSAFSDLRPVRVRVLERNEGPTNAEIRLELTEDDKVSLIRVCSISATSYKEFAAANGLKIEFAELGKSITDLLISSVEKPPQVHQTLKAGSGHHLRFTEGEEDRGQLFFLQKLRLRSVTILTLAFMKAPADFVRSQVQYRFNSLKVELQRKANDYNTQTSRLRQTNPSLEKQLRSTVKNLVDEKVKK